MTAPQTAWAQPLGKQLVELFRETDVWFIQRSFGTYDPLTGNIGLKGERVWHCGAAVVSKLMGPHAAFNIEGFASGTDAVLWFDSTTLPVEPTPQDQVWYQGVRWSVSRVDPLLESGRDFYAYKVTISSEANATYQNSGPPPATPGVPFIESIGWLYGGNAPGQPDPHGVPQIPVLAWQTRPQLTAAGAVPTTNLPVGTVLAVSAGTVIGGTGPYTQGFRWLRAPVTATGAVVWTAIPGAVAGTYTTTAADSHHQLRVEVTRTDSETPPKVLTDATNVAVIGPQTLQAKTSPSHTPMAVKVGDLVTAVPGTAQGGAGAITYETHFEISADGKTWATLPATDPAKPLEVLLAPGTAGQRLRVVTTATDSDTPPSSISMHDGLAGVTIAGTAAVPLAIATAPTVAGTAVTGATLTGTNGTATGGVGVITYSQRWQSAPAAAGPWTDLPGATGTTYKPTAAELGLFLRFVTTATDAATPVAHTLDIPSAATPAVGAGLAVLTPPGLPTGVPHAGVAWGPIAPATFTGGVSPVAAVKHQWQSAAAQTGPWGDLAGQTGTTLTPDASLVGQWIRVVDSTSDSNTPPDVASAASAAAQVGVAVVVCAGGAVIIERNPPGGVWVKAGLVGAEPGLYCDTGVWMEKPDVYLHGFVGHGYVNATSGNIILQTLPPSTQITYTPPKGVADDWRNIGDSTWVNLRTGVTAKLDAYRAVGTTQAKGLPLNPGVVGYIVDPTPSALRTIETPPKPAPGPWVKVGTAGTLSIPVWRGPKGDTVVQWGDPAVIGAVGAPMLQWLGTGPDPWVRVPYNPATGTQLNEWSNPATGQVWPEGGGDGPWGQRPQPWDTATIVVPAGGTPPTGTTVPSPKSQYWPRRAVPNLDAADGVRTVPYANGTPNPGWDPLDQLPGDAPATPGGPLVHQWWNYWERRLIHSATKPVASQWVESTVWAVPPTLGSVDGHQRQTDGRLVFAAVGVNPDSPVDTEADWVEFPVASGHWYHLTKSIAYGLPGAVQPDATHGGPYLQRWNPGRGVLPAGVTPPAGGSGIGVETNPLVLVPVGAPGDWTRSGAGTAGAPWKWTQAGTGTIVEQPMNPGVSGIVGTTSNPIIQVALPGPPTGNLQVGAAVTVTTIGSVAGGVGTPVATVKWQISPDGLAGWTDLPGVGGAMPGGAGLLIPAAALNQHLRVTVTWTDTAVPPHTLTLTGPQAGPVKAAAPRLVKDTDPTLTGAPVVGGTITIGAATSHGGTLPVTHAVKLEAAAARGGPWVDQGVPAGPYVIAAGLRGQFLRVTDTITDSSPTPQVLTEHSTVIGPVVDAIVPPQLRLQPPTPPAQGAKVTVDTLVAATGGTAPIDLKYQWEVAATAAGPWVKVGGNAADYTPKAGDVGKLLHCVVTWTDHSTPPQTGSTTLAAAGPITAATTYTTDPNGDHWGDGDWRDWTWTQVAAPYPGRPAGRVSSIKWTNAKTGAVLWQTGNPGIPVPLGALWDATYVTSYSIGPTAPGGPFVAGGFVWRHPDTFHFDTTHKAWISDTHPNVVFSQQGNAGVNPHQVPTKDDTGPWINPANGWHYAEMSAPPTITWVQKSPGVWQKMVSGSPSGAPLTQTDDPSKQVP